MGRYSVSDTNGHEHNCCTALTVTSGFGVEDRVASVPEMQTKHKLMMARDFLGEIAGMLGKQKCMLNVVCALNSRSGICKVASIKFIGRVGAACVCSISMFHAQNSLRLHSQKFLEPVQRYVKALSSICKAKVFSDAAMSPEGPLLTVFLIALKNIFCLSH